MKKDIIQCITHFIRGGDNRDLDVLNTCIHKDFRNIQSGFFDKKGLCILTKPAYLKLIKNGTFGGIKRDITYESLTINGDIASAQIILESKTMIFHSLLTLFKDNNQWFIIGHYPDFKYK